MLWAGDLDKIPSQFLSPRGRAPNPMHRVKTIQRNGTEDYLLGANCPAEKRESHGCQGPMSDSNWERNKGWKKEMGRMSGRGQEFWHSQVGRRLSGEFPRY